jgi:hypothetical protein
MAEDIDSAPAQAPPSDRGGALEGRLPLVLTVGFTGHRSVDDVDAAARLIAATFADVMAAFVLITLSPLAAAFEGRPRLRLLAGGAPGTDRLAQDAWRKAGLGERHAIYPFQNPVTGGAATDDPGKQDPATLVDPGPEFGTWTGIDALGLGLQPAQAHAEVGRWLVRHADLLVAWWDGKQGHGLGGANDTVRRALERGLPVIWLAPGAAAARLISLAGDPQHADATEAVEAPAAVAAPLTPAALAGILGPALGPPSEAGPNADRADAAARRDYARLDPTVLPPGPVGFVRRLADNSLWRSFRLFERIAGGKRAPARPSEPPPAAVAAQPGYVRLLQAADEAGARADQLSGIHRSEQVLLIWIAMLAVLFGAAPALDLAREYHLDFAAAEFILGFCAFVVTFAAQRAHRHRRWSDARRLAERLRSALATWPLGFDVADARVTPAGGWTEWRALAVLRAAGPRRGWVTRARFEETVAWAAGELIDGQSDYHRRQHTTARNIERTLGWTENIAFLLLMGVLAAYLMLGERSPHWFSGIVTLVSAFAPAVAAGCLALEATNGFRELKERNERLAIAFEAEKTRLGPVSGAAYHHVVAVMRRAAQLRIDDADAWRDRLLRRRIVRGA